MKLKSFFTYAIPVILIAVALQYTIFSVLSVRKKMKTINEQLDTKLMAINGQKVDSAFVELYRKKLWLETRNQIARTDEISLSVNLKDSLLQLELKGVVIKASKVLYFEADEFFNQLGPGAYYHLFSTQAKVDTCFSTIAKQPFVIKKAPKDTASVETSEAKIDSAKVEAVHWMMRLNNDVVFKIEGVGQNDKSDWWAGRKFWLFHDLKETSRNLFQSILFNVPEYRPEIRIVIREADARAIYRALPDHHLVSVRL